MGVRSLLLVGLTTAGALFLAWRFDSKVAETAATALLAAGPLYITWKAFKHDRVDAAAVDLTAVADRLADAVRAQWEAEAEVRRVNDPYPLPVAWRAADPDLVESWELLTDLARAWPGGPPGDPARWPASANGLAGGDAQIGEVFSERVPTRRLVVLGEPGAGKSVLLIHLLQDLIARRPAGGPVPVLFSLASWDPNSQRLQEWMAEQLRRAHPGLRAPASAPAAAATTQPNAHDLAQELLDARLILPLLDGFDELPPALHAVALGAINRTLPAKQPLVLAARAAEYRAVVTRPDAVVRLNGAAGIHLLSVTREQAADYLRRDAGGSHTPAAQRWDAVIARLGTDTPVGQALGTPLGLFLARTIYNPRPQVVSHSVPVSHPDELCDTTTFPNRSAVDRHLFNAFIPASYSPHSPAPSKWSTGQAHRTLAFLARNLETKHDGSPDLVWWEIPSDIPRRAHFLLNGLLFGLIAGILTGYLEESSEIPIGVLSGAAAGVLVNQPRGPVFAPVVRTRWSPRAIVRGIKFGILVWIAMGIYFSFMSDLSTGFKLGLAFALSFGIAATAITGIDTEEADPTTPVGPLTLLARDRRSFLALGISITLAIGVSFGLLSEFIGQSPDPLKGDLKSLAEGFSGGFATGFVKGVLMGLVIGLGVGGFATVWLGFVLVRAYLAACHKTPWDLMTFLQDAHQRGVLRQVGAVYQFRHIDLQRHLAQQPWPPVA
ncbi:NACHT domain-containing protein [Streptomyces glaucosporus]|uniref:NACHT domain-containing protein n=1 Tax=Streptomyces glaucosporus TaxID=284044 RepID=UPI0031D550CB